MAQTSDIAGLSLTAREYAQLDAKLSREETFSLADYETMMSCSNPKCNHGGFTFAKAVSNMAKSAKTTGNGVVTCKGKVTIHGSGMKDSCRHIVRWTATVRYKGSPVTA